MRAIVDADTMVFASAVMAEGLDVSQAFYNVENAIERLSARLNGLPMTFYLTGSENFRYQIFPEYKLNRRNQPRPTHLQSVKEYLVEKYKAVISDGCEADDLCGIDQFQSNAMGEETILVSIDKDLDMIPGKHYRPAIWREGVEISPEREYVVSPIDAIRFFYWQLLVGDSGDGIKGAIGIGKVKATKILEGLINESDLLAVCRDYFSCDQELELNGACLWIWREPDGIWKIPNP